MENLLRTTAERAARYLAGLKNRGVAPTPEALANLRRLDEPLPEHPTDPAAVITLLDEIGSPAPMALGGRRAPACGGMGSDRGARRPPAHCGASGRSRHALAARRAGVAAVVRPGV